MSGQKVGYIRVSTLDQNSERQLEGLTLDRVFTDKASDKDTKRPELDETVQNVGVIMLASKTDICDPTPGEVIAIESAR